MGRELVESFIPRFKIMMYKCKIHLPKAKYVKIAQKRFDTKLSKKF